MTFITFWHEVRFWSIFDCPSKRVYNLHLVWLISLLLYLRNFEWRQYNTFCWVHQWKNIVLYLNFMINYFLTKTTFLFLIYVLTILFNKELFCFYSHNFLKSNTQKTFPIVKIDGFWFQYLFKLLTFLIRWVLWFMWFLRSNYIFLHIWFYNVCMWM